MQHEPPKPHHHGNLRNALIEAGIDLLKEGGLPNLTLRKCAALAGVSHAAPAHHFDGLDGLRQAIASEGFSRFRQAMLDASDQVSGARQKKGPKQCGFGPPVSSTCIGSLTCPRAREATWSGPGPGNS